MTSRPKLIEVALPLDAINEASVREGFIYRGNPSAIHKWWAQRPLAACRAILFGQLVDDPSGWPEQFPTEESQDAERERLFAIIRELVIWENSNNPETLYKARLEIARTFARRDRCQAQAEGIDTDSIIEMMPRPPADDVNRYLATRVPPVHDPFAGGGSIPLEAQRLGLRSIATDLNPVAVMINRVMIEAAPTFADRHPVRPGAPAGIREWRGTSGLAEDIRHYGKWMRERAAARIGPRYPAIRVTAGMAEGRPDLRALVGSEVTPFAWIWARTVASPSPLAMGVRVPLQSTGWLSRRKGREVAAEAVADADKRSWTVRLRVQDAALAASAGTKASKADFRCVLTGAVIPAAYITTSAVKQLTIRQHSGRAPRGRTRQRLRACLHVPRGGRTRL